MIAEGAGDPRRPRFVSTFHIAGEAEDIVQEAFVRYQRSLAEGTAVESPKAYLSAVVTRLAIDHLKSARVRRDAYVGEWLPVRGGGAHRSADAGHVPPACGPRTQISLPRTVRGPTRHLRSPSL